MHPPGVAIFVLTANNWDATILLIPILYYARNASLAPDAVATISSVEDCMVDPSKAITA